jgi:phospholipid/cholesterol/gamma-HCH transport system substrate-binding protein
MLKKLNYEAKVGILVFVATAMLILGYNWLKGNDIFAKYNHMYAEYKDLQGLTVSSPVRINGYTVGRVSNIDFKAGLHPRIIVRLSLKKGVTIPSNTVARIVNVDVFGTKNIDLVLGDATVEAKENDTLTSDIQDDLATSLGKQLLPVKSKAEGLVSSLDTLVRNISATLNKNTINQIHQSIEHITASLAHINQISGDLGHSTEEINDIVRNVRSISANIKNNNESISKIIGNLGTLTDTLKKAEINKTVQKLNATLHDLDITLTKLNNGEGSAGLLLNDKRLYNNLEADTRDLDSLINKIKQHPNKLVNFSVFGHKG